MHPFLLLLFFFLLTIAGISFSFSRTVPLQESSTNQQTTLPKDIETAIDTTATTAATFRIPILMYHYIEIVTDTNDTIRQSLAISPTTFDAQIQTLKDNGYTFLTMYEVASILAGDKNPPQKPVVLTFDDGYRDFYTDVLPMLKKHNVQAVAYLCPQLFGKPNYMYEWQIREVINSGLVEIGAHTMTHLYLKGASKKAATKEIMESKHTLQRMFTLPVVSFAYPYGAFDEQAMEIVKQAGFHTAVSTVPGITVQEANKFFLYRIRPGKRTGKTLTSYLEGNTFRAY